MTDRPPTPAAAQGPEPPLPAFDLTPQQRAHLEAAATLAGDTYGEAVNASWAYRQLAYQAHTKDEGRVLRDLLKRLLTARRP